MLSESRRGSEFALGQLLNSFREYLLAIAEAEMEDELRRKGSPSDLVQETFVEAQRDFRQFTSTSEGDFRVWLRALLANNLADLRKRFKRTAKRRLSLEKPLGGPEAQQFLNRLAIRGSSSPSKQLMSMEAAKRVEAALERLRPEYREIILWHGREELSFVEIGQRLGRSADAVRMLFNRAIARLRRELGDDHAK